MKENKRKTAEDFAKEQKDISVSEFFEKNKHLLGFDNPTKSLLMAVKEAVDNSLDACEEGGILPDIVVKIKNVDEDTFIVSVIDNGPGIIKENIPKTFAKLLHGSKFHRLRQSLAHDEPIMLTENGKVKIIPIGEFADGLLDKDEEVKDISHIDIKVPAFDWKNYRYKFRKVSHVIRHERENEILRIRLHTNREIKVTGCHSLFSAENGSIKEVEARNLKVGDYIAVPGAIASPEEIGEINILDYIEHDDIKNNWFYVYGVEKELLDELYGKFSIIHKKTDKSRRYYKIGGVEILDDSWKQYTTKGFLPLWLVLKLGLQNRVKNCVLRSYQHGKETSIPLTISLEPYFMRFLGIFTAEGHVDKRQIGLTLGKHEDKLIEETLSFARKMGVNFTLETRDRSVRIKIFGGIFSTLFEKWCGKGAHNKHVPEFVFRSDSSKRQHFIDGLYQGDGHKVKERNCIMLSTVSKRLSNEIIYLWLMQGVTACLTKRSGIGLGKFPYTAHVVSVYGNDINKSHVFKTNKPTRTRSVNFNSSKLMTQLKSDILLLPIKSIEAINDGYDFVYDVSVPECENFVGGTGGIACHNSRGQQGIGISSVTLYSQLTTGVPTKVWSKTESSKKTNYFEIHLDTAKNEPQIVKSEESEKPVVGDHGVRVDVEIHGRYRKTVENYLKQTSISNPFAKITYTAPDGRKIIYPRSVNELPKDPKMMNPHPYGVEFGVLQRIIHKSNSRTLLSFLTNEFSSVGTQSAREICKLAKLKEDEKPQNLDRANIEKLLKAMHDARVQRPPTDCLSPIGSGELEKSLKKEYQNAEFVTAVTREPEVYRGFPFLMEVGIIYGFSDEKRNEEDDDEKHGDSIELIRFANRVPLLYQQSACALTEAAREVDWRRYNLQQSGNNLPVGPMKLVIHICSVWVPFVSESKEAVASYPEIVKEAKLALQDAGRKLSIFLSGKRKAGDAKRKVQMFERYAGEVSHAISVLSGQEEKLVEKKLRGLIEGRVHIKEEFEEAIEKAEHNKELKKEVLKEKATKQDAKKR